MGTRRLSSDSGIRKQAELEAQRIVVDKIKQNLSSYNGLKLEVPNVHLDAVIGLEEIKQEMLNTLNRRDCGRQRILLFGAFYCGKSHLVRGLATHLKANIIDVWDEDILFKWVNKLETFTQALYEVCKEKASRTILFLEQVDNLEMQLLIRFLENVQRIWMECSEGKSSLIIIGTTFEPKHMKKEVVMHFNKRIYIPTPNFHERKQLILKYISDISARGASLQLKDKDVDWLAKKLYGCVPLEIETKIHEGFKAQAGKEDLGGFMKGLEDICKRPLTKNDFKKAFKNRAPCPMDLKTFDLFSGFQKAYGNGPFMSMQERENHIFKDHDAQNSNEESGKDATKSKSSSKSFVARLVS